MIMAKIRILLAENDADFRDILAQFLTGAGYYVATASSPEEATAKLQTEYFHLAILDMRLRNDLDNKDRTGLQIAKWVAPALPKLILTKFPHHEDVVEVMKPRPEGLPAAVDYLNKKKRLPEILTAIQEAIEKHLQFNWNLVIQQETASLTLAHLVHTLEPNVAPASLAERIEEIGDLFRHIFQEYDQITLHDLLLTTPDCVHLALYAHAENGLPNQFVLVCGPVAAIKQIAANYETALPRRVRQAHLPQGEVAETVHFAAVAYQVVTLTLAESWPLYQVARQRPTAEVQAAVTHLYTDTLDVWHKNGRFLNRETDLTTFYRARLAEQGYDTTETAVQAQVAALCHQLTQVGLGPITTTSQQLSLSASNGQETLPNPAGNWLTLPVAGEAQWGMTHGQVDLDTVLVTETGQSWLLNFSQAGEGPLVHDFVSLEAAIWLRLPQIADLATTSTLLHKWLPHFPFLSPGTTADRPSDDLTPAWLVLVGHIRQLAQQQTGCGVQTYLTALLFQLAQPLLRFEPMRLYHRERLAAYMRALLGMAVLCRHLTQTPPNETATDLPQQAHHSLWIDDINKVVWVEGKQIELTIQDFQILSYLYQHTGKLCDRKSIVEEGLGEVYDELDLEQSRLNSAMSRLRQKIEPDARNARYLITVRGHGYRLNLPKSR
jgi:DNA-binding response OmpR family regulator